MKKQFLFFLFLLVMHESKSQVKPANIFTSHMVLQRDKPIQIWGQSSPKENISVTLSGNTIKSRADKNGHWDITFPAMTAGGPHTILIKGKNETRLEDILIGDVWVCSGQSNMEWKLNNVINAQQEIAAADYPQIRHFTVAKSTSFTPLKDIENASWEVCSPSTAGGFTAVGYFFARELYKALKIPVGLVHSSWGGTMVETWISRPSFESHPEFSSLATKIPVSSESVFATTRKKMDDLVKAQQGSLPAPGVAGEFKTPGYDDAAWKTMNLPGLWENKGLTDLDGEVWFRKEFQVPADIPVKDAVLHLAMIDDMDSVFLNGIFIGRKTVYNEKRVYKIPAGLLKGTTNNIAVKVMDSGGGGGIYGEASEMHVEAGSVKIPLSGEWKYRIEKIYNDGRSVNPNAYPTLLYNAMIHPIIRYPIKGAIWYQGENNTGRAWQYRESFPLMISDWRRAWKDSFPFYFVQLTHFRGQGGMNQNGGSDWAELREAQESALRLSNTGMAVIIDIGESNDIHPRNKQDVGKRLALQALAGTYSQKAEAEGPRLGAVSYNNGKACISFRHAGGGLVVKNKYGYIHGFEIAGSDKQFHYAKAWVEDGKVVVFSEKVKDPVAVRYAWADDPNDLNLFNQAGLPAAPFRTDNWPAKTRDKKFDFN